MSDKPKFQFDRTVWDASANYGDGEFKAVFLIVRPGEETRAESRHKLHAAPDAVRASFNERARGGEVRWSQSVLEEKMGIKGLDSWQRGEFDKGHNAIENRKSEQRAESRPAGLSARA